MQKVMRWFIRLVHYDMKYFQCETNIPERKQTNGSLVEKKTKETIEESER